MKKKRISIVDYGVGNLLSVSRAFSYLGQETELISEPDKIENAEYLVLPGVGAFPDGMRELQSRNLVSALCRYTRSNRPLLGICLGMQMLFDMGTEHSETRGLGLIPGQVVAIPQTNLSGESHKIPHIGWGDLNFSASTKNLSKNLPQACSVYFVHSFMAATDDSFVVASTSYGGWKIAALVNRANVWGAQFHPEKSGQVGLEILKNFFNDSL